MAYTFNPLSGKFDYYIDLGTLDSRYVNVTGDTMTDSLKFIDATSWIKQTSQYNTEIGHNVTCYGSFTSNGGVANVGGNMTNYGNLTHLSTGSLIWLDEAFAPDVNLYWGGAGILKTDANFHISTTGEGLKIDAGNYYSIRFYQTTEDVGYIGRDGSGNFIFNARGSATAGLRFSNENSGGMIFRPLAGDITFTPDSGNSYFEKGNVGIGTTSPVSLTDISSTTGGVLTLSRNDTSATAADVIGTLQWWNNDTQLTTQKIYANINVTATSTVTTDAAAGTMKFNVTGSTAGGSPIEHIAFAPTTVAQIGFFGATPVVKPTALTTQLTTLTYVEPGTPDYAIQTVQLVGYGFATADEGNSVLKVIANLQTRVSEFETKLQGLGLLT